MRGNHTEQTPPRKTCPTPVSVIMIDDDIVDGRMLSRTVEPRDHISFRQYTNALDAEPLWSDPANIERNSVFFIDLEMPRIDGFQLLEKLLAAIPAPDRPLLVAYSGCLTSVDPEKLARFDAAYEKPMSMAGMHEIVDDVLGKLERRRLETGAGYTFRSSRPQQTASAVT